MRNKPQVRPPAEPFEFVWSVRKKGYSWVRARLLGQHEAPPPPPPPADASHDALAAHFVETERTRPVLCLTDGVPSGEAIGTVTRYKPMSLSSLFLDFAQTSPTEGGVLGFATRYGTLLGPEGELIRPADAQDKGPGPALQGEPGALWYDEIVAMREAVRLWQALKRNSPDLARLIRWQGDRAVKYVGKHRHATIAERERHPDLWNELSGDKLRKPALLYLLQLANEHIEGRASPRLLFTDSELAELALYVVPHTLLGALWLQLIRAVDGNREYRRCSACRRWFEIAPDAKRKTAVTCSDACRMRRSRQRRGDAGVARKPGADYLRPP